MNFPLNCNIHFFFFFYKIILTRKCVKLKKYEFSRQIAMFCFDFRIDDFTRIFISKYVIILGT